MDKLFHNNSGETTEHPPREMLLLFVDGELASKESAQLEAHLEACWPCRVKTKKIQEAIADIIEFDEQVLTPRIIPPQGWRKFDRKLRQLAEASGKQSLSIRLFGSLNRFLPSSHLFSLPRPLLIPMVRNVIAVLMIVLIVVLVIRFKHEPTVSASELLKNAIDAQSRQIQAIDQAVLHQKLQLRRKAQTSTGEESVNWEIWNDTRNARVRQFLASGNQSVPIAPSAGSTKGAPNNAGGRELINELARVLETNHMDPQRPLSAVSYQSWHNTLHNQQDQVTKSKVADGNDALTLRTIPASPINVGQIAEAVFVVGAKDWQPVELRLTVAAQDGNQTYELNQTITEVVTLAQVNPAIFADQPIASTVPAASPKETSKTQPTPALSVNPQPLNPAPATADLEVEVLQLLHEARADLGEQITVTRSANGLLQVTGIVETSGRKAEIMRALQPVTSHAAVRIEIQTVAEAVAEQQRQAIRSKATPGPISQQNVEINSEAVAAAPELRRYFQSDEQMRQFASRMVTRSRNALRHVYAMKRLLGQFSAEQLRALSPDARNKWLGLTRSHARAYRVEAESLRGELQPIFFPSASGSAVPGPDITDDASLIRAVEQLFRVAVANDAVIRSAFTTSSESFSASAINTGQFWQSLKSAEALAAKISGQ
jgi:hypothetical protein